MKWIVKCNQWDLNTLINELLVFMEDWDIEDVDLEADPSKHLITVTNNHSDNVRRVEWMFEMVGVKYERSR